jgi:hypothetical protein
MKISTHRKRRFRTLRAVALALAVAAVAAPPAFSDPIDAYVQQQRQSAKFVPGVTDFPPNATTVAEGARTYGLPRPTAADLAPYLASTRANTPSRFDWSDAAVGVGIGVAGALALMGLIVVGRTRLRIAHA